MASFLETKIVVHQYIDLKREITQKQQEIHEIYFCKWKMISIFQSNTIVSADPIMANFTENN